MFLDGARLRLPGLAYSVRLLRRASVFHSPAPASGIASPGTDAHCVEQPIDNASGRHATVGTASVPPLGGVEDFPLFCSCTMQSCCGRCIVQWADRILAAAFRTFHSDDRLAFIPVDELEHVFQRLDFLGSRPASRPFVIAATYRQARASE